MPPHTMELQRTPSNITINTYSKLLNKLYQIDVQVIHFTNLPIHTPGLHLLAQHIVNKFVFFRNFLTAESNSMMPDDLLEIERQLVELEAEFYGSNFFHVISDHDDDDGSVCESCLNNDREFEGSDASETLYEYHVMVSPPPEEFRDSTMPDPIQVEEPSSSRKRRRRWWWRTVVILMPASVVWAVSYFDKKQHQGFLTPT